MFGKLKIIPKYQHLRERFYKTIQQQLFVIKEKPRKVVLGCVLGIVVNFIPTLGLGFLISFFLAKLFRINPASALITSLVTGPLVPLMYAFNFLIGGSIFASTMGMDSIAEFIVKQYSLILKVGSIKDQILDSLELFGLTFMVGALINSITFGVATYFIVSLILRKIISDHSGR
jgi:uncharacterized protein (DUF2062 family)